jgi:DNA polymerase, archaea type
MDQADGLQMLFGADQAAGLVGCAPSPHGIHLWWRRGSETVHEEMAFKPYFLVSDRGLLDDYKPECQFTELHGSNYYKWRVECLSWEHQDAAVKHVSRFYRSHKTEFESEPWLVQGDPIMAYMLETGRTHYKGMGQAELRVLYIALRAVSADGAEYADPSVAEDRIAMIGLSDGGEWTQVIEGDEKAILEQLNEAIAQFDPDVIAGHDLFKGCVNYIALRAKRHKVKLPWGRDETVVRIRSSRAPAAEKQLEYPRADVAGRSLVDTWFLTQYYDIVKRELERYDAPYVARYLDSTCTLEDRIEQWDIEQVFNDEPQRLADDLRCELSASQLIFRTLVPSYFAQAQMLPISLQDCVVRGNGVKINWLLMREYLRRGESIPDGVRTFQFIGGFTELRRSGLIHDVLSVDIASLYPSIMLRDGVRPGADTGEVFNPMLRELTKRRLEAKQLARTAPTREERVEADARQAAFKIFINSFFGYLGTDRMNWADPSQGEYITTTGQKLVKQLAEIVEEQGGSVIEIDTDGVYFTAPETCKTADDRAELEKCINAKLPDGITAELGDFYPSMLSHRIKNYALLSADGEITVKGSGMKSRGLEPYLHKFIAEGIADILRGRPEDIQQRYSELRAKIESRAIDIRQLAKTDTLINTLEIYKSKIAGSSRNRAAAYEVALRARRPLRSGDQVSYYITGEKKTVKAFEAAKPLREYDPAKPDYNIAFYVKKLDENLKKVQGFMTVAAGQGGDLFEEES